MIRSVRQARFACLLTILCGFLLVGCGEPAGPELVAWPEDPDRPVVITNVRILDVATGARSTPADVRVADGVIASIDATGAAEHGDARVIDGGGGTLLPGLVDMHGHVYGSTRPAWELTSGPTPLLNLRSYAYSGVTTVFDPGDGSGDAFERRAQVAARELIGPQIFTVGPILTAPSSHPLAMVEQLAPVWIAWYIAPWAETAVPDEAAATVLVDEIAADGADGIKIVVDQIPLEAPRMLEERARNIVERAARHDLRVVAHIGSTEDALIAGRAGVALWVHGVYKERIPDEAIAELVGFGIPMATTSEVFDSYGRARSGPRQATRLERETVPADLLDDYYPFPDDFDPGPLGSWIELMERTRDARLDNVRRLHAAGMTILAGSDTQTAAFPGPALHRELATLVEAGLTPAEAIRAATLDPARWLTREDDPSFGVVAVGKRADLLLVEGDPTADIGALEGIQAVLLAGVPIERRAVDAPADDDG